LIDSVDHLITHEMRACIGRASPPVDLPEEISASDVRRFVDIVGETNMLYRDAEYARQFGYKGRVVPPMVVVQMFRRIDDEEGKNSDWQSSDWLQLPLPADYSVSRNAGHEFAWLAPVYVGDRLTIRQRFTDIYAKQGRAGVPVIYLVREVEIRNQHGQAVVRQTSTTAKLPTSFGSAE
jgi:acyl dehydratase